jgi:molecular chaperone GrpE
MAEEKQNVVSQEEEFSGEKLENAAQEEKTTGEQVENEETTVSTEEQLLKKIEELEKEKEELTNKYLRAQADLQNFRNRVNREKQQMLMYQSQRVIEALLPVMDNFERAIAAGKSENSTLESMLEGIEMVFRQIEAVFEQEGVQVIPAVGQPFDPNVHQAVMQEESDQYEPGIVVKEFQKGYQLKGRVIRPSMVSVSS